ncbi:MAG: alpha/beta hydrolase [Chloroflexi bacterium]|nr:alpha/beta hydrolase [Chloroflexota bacterium]
MEPTHPERAAAPRELRINVNGINLAVYEWPGEGPPVLFAHATGHHARCWDTVIRRLPGVRAYSVDQRGHGRSDKPDPPYPWRVMGQELAVIAERLDLQQVIGVGHSMGGRTILQASAVCPERFAGLVLVDPPVGDPSRVCTPRQGEHPTARRRDQWASPEEMFNSFKGRSPFNRWLSEALWDYCRYGLLPDPSGEGYVLACPPKIEAGIYGSGIDLNILEFQDRLSFPIRVLRARPRTPEDPPGAFGPSATWPDLAKHLPNAEDYQFMEYSHFIPQEAPDVVAEHIRQVAALTRVAHPAD